LAISPESSKQPRGSILSDIERMIVLQFNNRFIWLTLLLAGLMLAHLTIVQINALQGLSPYGNGLSTFDLLASLMLIIESATLAVMLLSILGEDALRQAWLQRWPTRRFNHVAAGMSSMPTQLVAALILMLPTLYMHRYPELSAAQNISIPLTLLQRFLLLFLAIQLCTNLILILRWFTPLPRWLAALFGLCGYWALGYWMTVMSFTSERFMRLNDVFFYNQLWKHIDGYPDLMRSRVTLDINRDFLGFFMWMLLAVSITTLLWLPRAALAGDKNQKSASGATVAKLKKDKQDSEESQDSDV
jgi:hypothetical protein